MKIKGWITSLPRERYGICVFCRLKRDAKPLARIKPIRVTLIVGEPKRRKRDAAE